ncbi:glycosyltransferase [Pseudoalteromonas sp. T1lg23B]|uniref:glycosyltransferase n=1 Tax=Pseudoalteromonas sp. T1lg23B TaxID=2077097 RepID=UPI000CF6E439|nr:glycosyltransferase [Pseudoalteromonas sp. T1lg23B]
MSKELVSVVIRTLNEERYLPELLAAIKKQQSDIFEIEVVIVDSGSTDDTLKIAEFHDCRITYIKKQDFTFGRSLNVGCDFAQGQYLIFISGHCIPCDELWVHNLVAPLVDKCQYTYGRQVGRDNTKFSERQLFDKYFPRVSCIPQEGFFCNNANAAIRKDTWEKYKFDETLTGCEDMYLAKQLVEDGGKVGYVADAPVFHIHDETWGKVKIRYEREAIALQKILPHVHMTFFDMLTYIFVGIAKDVKEATKQKRLLTELYSIFRFRLAQYYGGYLGNHITRKLSHETKLAYFYPRVTDMEVSMKPKNLTKKKLKEASK